MRRDRHYRAAATGDPKGVICAFCGMPNDNWDADGFFYLWPEPSEKFSLQDGRAACKACCAGEPGQAHERLHGKGNGKR